MKEKIQLIYNLSIDLWFKISDDNMKRCGHPGIIGPTSNEPWNEQLGILKGAIRALEEVSEKIK